jgi:hypothetical protein
VPDPVVASGAGSGDVAMGARGAPAVAIETEYTLADKRLFQSLLDSGRPGCERMRLINSTQAIKKRLPEREATKI